MKKRKLVDKIPINANVIKKTFFFPVKSAIAPKIGANTTIMNPEIELTVPSKAVEATSLNSPAQNDLKKRGKNPANTVVAKTEFAQSYNAQENFSLKLYLLTSSIQMNFFLGIITR